jgi:hypothetical protein
VGKSFLEVQGALVFVIRLKNITGTVEGITEYIDLEF